VAKKKSDTKKAGGKSAGSKKATQHNAVRSTLGAVLTDQTRVKIRRSITGSDTVDGFVVATGTTWTVLALLDGSWMALDGYVALRTADITKVEHCGGPDSFVRKVLERQKEWPPRSPGQLDLDHVEGFVQSLSARFALMALWNETERPDELVVGHIVATTTGSVTALLIDPEASWYDEPAQLPLANVSRIDFATHYNAALSAIGGPPPSPAPVPARPEK
jgi:hypothetical protein